MVKVGDAPRPLVLLTPFGRSQYNLGGYGNLQGGGLVRALAEQRGRQRCNVNAVPEWASPAACQPGESPLQEFRRIPASP